MDKKSLTPQEKKALSLKKDRRNTYGNNDKAARKAIPRAKALANRAVRRADTFAMVDLTAAVEDLPLERPKPDWKKGADTPLGEVIASKLAWRQATRKPDGNA